MNNFSTRQGFGEALLEVGKDTSIVALSADLTESTQMHLFKAEYPERFFEVGVAEQNLVTVASGLAATGFKPFVASYAAFSPGRCLEQIRTTIALNGRNVKIIGAHAGLSVGPDGATHQALEDLSQMLSMPNMEVYSPMDYSQALRVTRELAKTQKPAYLRLSREPNENLTDQFNFLFREPLELIQGEDIICISIGPVTVEAYYAIRELAQKYSTHKVGLINLHCLNPLNLEHIFKYLLRARLVVVIEEHQAQLGFAAFLALKIAENDSILPNFVFRHIGVENRFGQSGTVKDLYCEYGLDRASIFKTLENYLLSTFN